MPKYEVEYRSRYVTYDGNGDVYAKGEWVIDYETIDTYEHMSRESLRSYIIKEWNLYGQDVEILNVDVFSGRYEKELEQEQKYYQEKEEKEKRRQELIREYYEEQRLDQLNEKLDRLNERYEDVQNEGYDEGYDEGYNEGYDEGYNEGYDKGYNEGRDNNREQNQEYKKDYDKNRIELKFIALNELNNVKGMVFFNKYNWFYGADLSNKLWLNLDNWTIYSDRGQTAHITEWKVNQNAHSMVLGQAGGDNYQKIDLAFVISMLGQLMSHNDLVNYLEQLRKEFINK